MERSPGRLGRGPTLEHRHHPAQSLPAKRRYSEIVLDAKERLLAGEFGEVEPARSLRGMSRHLHAPGARKRKRLRQPHEKVRPEIESLPCQAVEVDAVISAQIPR